MDANKVIDDVLKSEKAIASGCFFSFKHPELARVPTNCIRNYEYSVCNEDGDTFSVFGTNITEATESAKRKCDILRISQEGLLITLSRQPT